MSNAAIRTARALNFYLWHLVAAVSLAALLLALIYLANLDPLVSDLFFDQAAGVFPLRENWLLEHIAHVGFRNAVVGLALGLLLAWLASFRLPPLAPYRRLLLFLFLSMLIASSAVAGLKGVTGKHCPYDMRDFGGRLPYMELLDPLPPGAEPGRCWPGGHAASGFCLFGFYFASIWLGRRRWAAATLAGVLLLGFGVGMARVVQGAHFLSHNVWSALICWLIALALYEAMLRQRQPPAPRPSGTRWKGD
jgi:membrane-associated PAP2 superfamily phosphatase